VLQITTVHRAIDSEIAARGKGVGNCPKTIVTVAPTGAWPTKERNRNLPLNPREIADGLVY
jgi:hypothetical protein